MLVEHRSVTGGFNEAATDQSRKGDEGIYRRDYDTSFNEAATDQSRKARKF